MSAGQIAKTNAGLRYKSALDRGNPFSLAPGFSRVGRTTNAGNGFNRFLRAIASKPLKRLGRRPHLFTGLKPGANESPLEISSACIAEARSTQARRF